MAHRDYSKISKPNIENKAAAEPVEKPHAFAKGTVDNCLRLNIRIKPTKNGDVIRTLDSGYNVTVDLTKSTAGWYYIPSLNGYCTKEFIKLFTEVD